MDQKQRTGAFPVPLEITLGIFDHLAPHDRWVLASASRTLYKIAREHILFKELRLGWWPAVKQCKEAMSNFNSHNDPNAKLKADMVSVKEFGIGILTRKLKVAFAEAFILEKDKDKRILIPKARPVLAYHDNKLMEEMETLLSSTGPGLQTVEIYGTQSVKLYKSVIELISDTCPQLGHLLVDWRWTWGQPAADAFELSARFANLKKLEISLDVHVKAYGVPSLVYHEACLGNLAEPIIQASPALRDLCIKIDNEEDDDGIDWSGLARRLGKDTQLRSLDYYIAGTCCPIEYMLSDMSAICVRLERFRYHQVHHNIIDLDRLLPWFAKTLKKCRVLELAIDVPRETDESDDGGEYSVLDYRRLDADHSVTSHYLRRKHLTALAYRLPAIRHASWVDYSDYHEDPLNQLEMLVERDGTGAPARLGFRNVPVINKKNPKLEEELRLIHDTREYDFT